MPTRLTRHLAAHSAAVLVRVALSTMSLAERLGAYANGTPSITELCGEIFRDAHRMAAWGSFGGFGLDRDAYTQGGGSC